MQTGNRFYQMQPDAINMTTDGEICEKGDFSLDKNKHFAKSEVFKLKNPPI
jgi:hypothetical protein